MKNNKTAKTIIIVAALVFLFTLPFYAGAYTITSMIRVIYFGLLSMSVGMLIGQLGLTSMAQCAFFAMGAYVVGLIGYERGMPFPWADIIGVIFTVVVALLFGMIAMRAKDMVFMMITLAFGQVCWSLGTQNTSLLHGWLGIMGVRPFVIFGIDFNITQNYYWASLIIFIICVLIYRGLTKTSFGLALNGIRENPRRMVAMGYPIFWMKVVFFGFAAFFAAIGGILMFYNTGIITPTAMHMSRTSWILLCVILGGATYFWGPMLGTLIAVFFEVWVSNLTMRYNTILGIVFVLIVLFSPNGILGIISDIRKKRLAKNEAGTGAVREN